MLISLLLLLLLFGGNLSLQIFANPFNHVLEVEAVRAECEVDEATSGAFVVVELDESSCGEEEFFEFFRKSC